MKLLEKLIRRLNLTPGDTDVFIGGAGTGGVTANARLFGGLVAAQAAMAACRTVAEFPMHSLHAYFLRPGRPDADIEFHVTRSKEGRNFSVRQVAAWQSGVQIFQLQASFQRKDQGPEHQGEAPQAAEPEDLPNRDQARGRKNWRNMPIDVRMATPITANEALPPEQLIWLGVNGVIPADPALHLALVVYASDRCLLDTAWRPHAGSGELAGASLDHSMWFHMPPCFDDWLLYSTHSPRAGAARGLAMGALYDRAGRHVVSVAQEGLLRLR